MLPASCGSATIAGEPTFVAARALSGSAPIAIGGLTITIPGYMLWVAVLYSGLG